MTRKQIEEMVLAIVNEPGYSTAMRYDGWAGREIVERLIDIAEYHIEKSK